MLVWVWSSQVWKIYFYHQRWCCRVLSWSGVWFFHIFWNIANHDAITKYLWTVIQQHILIVRDVMQIYLHTLGILILCTSHPAPASGGVHTKGYSLGWPEQNCWPFLSSLLQDRDGFSLCDWGGQSWYGGFASPASLAPVQCYFLAGTGRAYTAFGRTLSLSCFWKSLQAHTELRKDKFSKRTKSREKSMQSFGLYLFLETDMVFAKI